MPVPLEEDCRFQDALYWEATGFDAYGEHTLAKAKEICVRWEQVNTEVIDTGGNTVGVDVVAVVDRVIPEGSIMWLGAFADLAGTSETPTSDIHTVIKYGSIPDIRGRNFRKVAYLRRLSDELPALT
jgi:hypothetical protein